MSALLKTRSASRSGRSTIRKRILAIAFVPSVVFLLAGSAISGYLIYDAVQVRSFATNVHDAAEPAGRFFAAVRAERRLTLQEIAGSRSLGAQLQKSRAATDTTAQRQAQALNDVTGSAPESVVESIEATFRQVQRLPGFRQRVDNGAVTLQEAYEYYNGIIDEYVHGLNSVARETPSAETAYMRLMAMPLFTASDSMSRGDALAASGLSGGGLTEEEFRSYISEVGAYHSALEQAVPEMIPQVRGQYDQLVSSEAWDTLLTVENAFLRGNQNNLPVPEAQWREAASEVSGTLWALYVQQSTDATNLAVDEADETLATSIAAGVAVLLISAAAFFFSWRLSNQLIYRLTTLRAETLDIAEDQMPRLVERVRGGDQVDLSSEMSYLEYGQDEIGQVADAFNKAQQTAVAAAVDEAKTREGTQRVFLNIAHRSQVIVHRQLQALDAAERKQEDPDQLDMLFRLDHLSTRARRNAENLIIMGGEQPGRQFRNPVAITDLVRGAVAETEDYKRVTMGKLPATAVAGPVVGDLVHLLAELIDNATSFSPPQSRVEVRGELVGRGAVVEVEDQGIGLEQEELDRLNETLRNPPDFSFMALSEEPRLGLFVVARLAAKHGLTVTLRESAYGGTRAIVLVRTDLLSDVAEKGKSVSEAESKSEGDVPERGAIPALSRRPRPLPKSPGQVNGSHDGPAVPTAEAADDDRTDERSGGTGDGPGTGTGRGTGRSSSTTETATLTGTTTNSDGGTGNSAADTAALPGIPSGVNGTGTNGHVDSGYVGGARPGSTGAAPGADGPAGNGAEQDDGNGRETDGTPGDLASRLSGEPAGDSEVTMTMPAATGWHQSEAPRDEAAEQGQDRPGLPRRGGAAQDPQAPQGADPRSHRGAPSENQAPPQRETQVQRDAHPQQPAPPAGQPQAHAQPQ
ncbi:sensor histidine kinase, partial [Saccharomonospora halophila]|uniref:sensor histidine kinase n=1 Tax=Saccharomonospora halophila TaxID=129922 RepID=UPI000686124A